MFWGETGSCQEVAALLGFSKKKLPDNVLRRAISVSACSVARLKEYLQ